MALVEKSFPDIITFTRSSGGGRWNAQGQYEWLPANQPRIDYDPVTGEAKGLLIEEQRTNLLTYSSDFANAAWGKGAVTIASAAAASPSGLFDASKLVEAASAGEKDITQTKAVTGQVSLTVFCKKAERSRIKLGLSDLSTAQISATADLDAVTITNASGGAWTNIKSSISDVGGGWFRITFSATAGSGTSVRSSVAVVNGGASNYTGDGTSGIYIWGAQLEVGSFPSSYIPTTSAQVTRAAEDPLLSTLSPWFNAMEGTLFVEASTFAATNAAGGIPAAYFATLQNAASTNLVAILRSGINGNQGLYVVKDSAQVIDQSASPSIPAGASFKSAVSIGDGKIQMATNGQLGPMASTQPPTVDRLMLGGRIGSSRYLNGHIRSIRYFPRRLSNTELQALTA